MNTPEVTSMILEKLRQGVHPTLLLKARREGDSRTVRITHYTGAAFKGVFTDMGKQEPPVEIREEIFTNGGFQVVFLNS